MKLADKKTPIAVVIAIIAIVIGFSLYNNNKQRSTPLPTAQPAQSSSVTYAGKLPCADCEGIEEEITITKPAESTNSGTFTLKDTYLGKDVPPYTTSGNWEETTGNAIYPNAKVYALNPDKPNETMYFLIVDENTIRMLDNQKQLIDSPFNQVLIKK